MKDLLTTAESRRRFGEGLLPAYPHEAVRYLAIAECMDAGTMDTYNAAVDAWRAAEPHPIDFVPDESVRDRLRAREDEAREKNQQEMEKVWGRRG